VGLSVYALRMLARQARIIRRQERANAVLFRALGTANDNAETAQRNVAAWQSRCEALFLIADPSKRDGVLSVLSSIESLEEA
jgi:hypothetical protein